MNDDKKVPKKQSVFLFITIASLTVLLAASGEVISEKTIRAEDLPTTRESQLKPKIDFEHSVYDFGAVPQGYVVTHPYPFKNSGSAGLVIEKVRDTCSCTCTILSKNRIPPKGRGEVPVIFNTSKYRGGQQHFVYVHSNDPEKPLVRLELKGFIMVAIPSELYLGNIYINEPINKSVKLLEPGENSPAIDKISSSSKYLHAGINTDSAEGIKDRVVDITLSPSVPAGTLHEEVAVFFRDKKLPPLRIPVTGYIEGEVAVSPKALFFGFVGNGARVSKDIAIVSNTTERIFKISGVESDLKNMSFEIIETEKGRKYIVRVMLDSSAGLRGQINGTIKIKIDNNISTFEIPVYALIQQ